MLNYILVAVGGAIGSVTRFWAVEMMTRRMGDGFPWGTLIVNITGSFLIGLFASAKVPGTGWIAQPNARVFLMAGVCGGYTTFSAFSLQTLALAQAGQWLAGVAYIFLSVVLCLVGVWLGYWLGVTTAGGA